MSKKKEGYAESELPMLLQSMASLSLVVVGCVGGFFFIGYLLDKYFGLGVPAMVASTFLGSLVAIYWAYRKVSVVLNKIYTDDADEEVSSDITDDSASKDS